jgi:hypothetical protein
VVFIKAASLSATIMAPAEECQGGIRYVIGCYHSANAAKIFWQQRHWY